MKDLVVGIDLGTSSIKAVCVNRSGIIARTTKKYTPMPEKSNSFSPTLWWNAVLEALHELSAMINPRFVNAIALTSQVGTYILYNSAKKEEELKVISWREGGGQEQLAALKARFDQKYFMQHISMPHPDLVSYPAPRMMWFRDNLGEEWEKTDLLLGPKDYLYYKLTGCFASDPYSWRGLANLSDCSFHEAFLNDMDLL